MGFADVGLAVVRRTVPGEGSGRASRGAAAGESLNAMRRAFLAEGSQGVAPAFSRKAGSGGA